MLRCLGLCLCVWSILCSAVAATAGAWPRPKGEGFVSASLRLAWTQDRLMDLALGEPVSAAPTSQYRTVFLEYGLTDRLTLGADIGHAVSGQDKAIGFVRWPIFDSADRPHKLAVELGLGRIDGENVIRPGVAYGYGFSLQRLSGWIGLETHTEIFSDGGAVDLKADVTFGLNLNQGRRAILQLQTGQRDGDDAFARIAPSVVFPLTDTRHLEIGGTLSLKGERDVGVMLGIWQSF